MTVPTLPPGFVKKTQRFKEQLHVFLSPKLLKDGSLPDNTSALVKGRDGAQDAALMSAVVNCSQGTAGSKNTDAS